jgi:hypothetical protein
LYHGDRLRFPNFISRLCSRETGNSLTDSPARAPGQALPAGCSERHRVYQQQFVRPGRSANGRDPQLAGPDARDPVRDEALLLKPLLFLLAFYQEGALGDAKFGVRKLACALSCGSLLAQALRASAATAMREGTIRNVRTPEAKQASPNQGGSKLPHSKKRESFAHWCDFDLTPLRPLDTFPALLIN